MNNELLRSYLANIANLTAIPAKKRTDRQAKAILKMQISIGQSKLMRPKNKLPAWWRALEKANPVARAQIAECVAVAQANRSTPIKQSKPKAPYAPKVNRPNSDAFLRHMEDEMDIPHGTLDVCMDAD